MVKKTKRTTAKKGAKTAKSKKNPKVGTSKKAKNIKSSRVKKQAARSKAKSPASKAIKKSRSIAESKAKKNKKEVKKPATRSKQVKKAQKNSEKITIKRAANNNKKAAKKQVRRETKHLEFELKNRFVSPTQLEVSEELLRIKNENEALHNALAAADPSHAPGKRHLNITTHDNSHHSDFEMNKRNELKARPEAYNKRGRATAPRATVPTN